MVVVNALLPRPQLYIQAITLQAYANLREMGRILIKDAPPKCAPEGAVPFCFSTDHLMQSPAPSPRADPCQQDGIPSLFPTPLGCAGHPSSAALLRGTHLQAQVNKHSSTNLLPFPSHLCSCFFPEELISIKKCHLKCSRTMERGWKCIISPNLIQIRIRLFDDTLR